MTAALQGFPFPFEGDTYRYSTNLEPRRELVVDVGADYRAVLADRARILAADPRRHAALPHMSGAGWDALDAVLTELHRAEPERTELVVDGDRRTWTNGLLGIGTTFERGRTDTIGDPLVFAAGQIQEDIVLLDTRDGQLYADAGVVTFASDWSMNFDLGMNFLDIHRPVPRVLEEGVIPRALSFLLTLDAHRWVRRTNWSLGVDHRLDASVEARREWEPARRALIDADPDEVGRRLCLRVEVQHLTRLAPSGAVMFLIRTHLASLDEVASVPGWSERLVNVIAELPDDMADYKGISPLRPAIARWWAQAERAG